MSEIKPALEPFCKNCGGLQSAHDPEALGLRCVPGRDSWFRERVDTTPFTHDLDFEYRRDRGKSKTPVFTREDVAVLENAIGDMAQRAEEFCVYPEEYERAKAAQDAVQSIIDRIEALLPPVSP